LAIAVLAVSNPLGIAIVRKAVNPVSPDELTHFWQMAVLVALVSVALMALVEWFVRRRLRARREALKLATASKSNHGGTGG
jgi:hypothetical protein